MPYQIQHLARSGKWTISTDWYTGIPISCSDNYWIACDMFRRNCKIWKTYAWRIVDEYDNVFLSYKPGPDPEIKWSKWGF